MRAMLDIVHGRYDNVEQTLMMHRVNHLPESFIPELQSLWEIAKKSPKPHAASIMSDNAVL